MPRLSYDQTEADEQREIAFWRDLTIWRKIQIIEDLYASAVALSLADLRRWYPTANDEELRAHLQERWKRLEQLDNAT